jgi:hypothetical protein
VVCADTLTVNAQATAAHMLDCRRFIDISCLLLTLQRGTVLPEAARIANFK